MKKILVVSVGGSYQPIVKAIESLKPERIVFFCSKGSASQVNGKGKPCEQRKGAEIVKTLPNIPTQLRMDERFDPDQDVLVVRNPDDFQECYEALNEKIHQLRRIPGDYQFMADYTGGTKTMSMALAMLSMDQGIPLYITTRSTRDNIIKVEHGEFTERVPVSAIIAQRKCEQTLPLLLENYNFAAAVNELQGLLREMELIPELKQKLHKRRDWCAAFECWDRFQHNEALHLLEPYMRSSEIQSYGIFLRQVIHSRRQIDTAFKAKGGTKGHGYELILDLLLNGDRCKAQQRYDDGLARIYRAVELLAQMRLLYEYEIKTGELDLQCIPDKLHEKYNQYRSPTTDKIELGLDKSYKLLEDLQDPLGQRYQENLQKVRNALTGRNHSFLAHGFIPVSGEDYEATNKVLTGFIREALLFLIPSKYKLEFPEQFPRILDFYQ